MSRFFMMLAFLLAAGALVFGVLTFLKAQPGNASSRTIPLPASKPVPAAVPAGEGTPPPASPTSALPTPPAQQPPLSQPPPASPEDADAKSPAMEALAVLEQFLTAKSLPERLPIIETKSPEAELATSCLARPLPPAPKMLLEFQESNTLEQLVDFYYSVDFVEENNRVNPQTILVRSRGGSAPKVVVDPFLDLYGGRLAAFAAKPSEKSGDFQVIAYAVASCLDPKIPNREKKLTLKLLARDNGKEVALAYFGKMSKIHEILEDGTYSLSYGKAKSCTVMLRWNTEDNPQYPYLEALTLKALDWNP